MTGRLISPLVMPKLTVDDQSARTGGGRRRRPTLAKVPQPRCSSLAYSLSAVDVNGRIVARTALQAMGWSAGDRVQMSLKAELIVVTADTAGTESLTAQGYLRLPLAMRSWHRLASGAHVLVVAEPDQHRLVIHPLTVLDTVISRLHGDVLDEGGDGA